MPSMMGGFGKYKNLLGLESSNSLRLNVFNSVFFNENFNSKVNFNKIKNKKIINSSNDKSLDEKLNNELNYNSNLSSYLAGLIEGDGTISVHDSDSKSRKYNPKIIIVFKKADLPLAYYLKDLINSGNIYIKEDRGYVLWQIQDLVGLFTIINIINGYMRTPKQEALERLIVWLNNYIIKNKNSNLPSTNLIISKIKTLKIKPIDSSNIYNNAWLAGFTDADGNFSINIHNRKNKNSTRVQLYYRLEITQNYHKNSSELVKISFFGIMSKIAKFLGVNTLSRRRVINEKEYFSFIVISANKVANDILVDYFSKYPLISSKYLDFKDWVYLLELQKNNCLTISYLDKAIKIRTNYNKTRKTFNWDHLKICYININ